MDTNQDGVSLQDVADLIEQEDDQITDESGEEQGAEEIADSDDSEAPETKPEEGDDGEEVEFEGKAYKVPKELKDALLRHSNCLSSVKLSCLNSLKKLWRCGRFRTSYPNSRQLIGRVWPTPTRYRLRS